MSVLIFHPMVAPHVQQAARALHDAGQLARFITSVCHEPERFRQRALTLLGRVVGLDLAREFGRRTVRDLPPSLVESHPWGELLRVAIARLDRDKRLSDFVWERTEFSFDAMVARRLHRGLTGVYGFEYSSLATFRRARRLGLRVAYEMPAPEPRFVHDLIDAETAKFPELRTAYHDYTAVREEQRIARRRAEWAAADVIIAASRFTRDSYARAGLEVGRVRIIPLGAPPAVQPDTAAAGGTAAGARLRLLWAGSFSIRKGAHYLLDAWREGRFSPHAQLDIYGSNGLPARLTEPLPDGISFHGSVPREELMARYQQSDALIFPTLCDGFGMVATEAWSRGLPVITTDNAGAADRLRPGENGLVIRAGDAAAIAGAVTWCLNHRAELRRMRGPAAATAAAWQWADYRRALAANLRDSGMFSR
ncbi:MAG TPA: glycosyltransferase family 4 protein [Lacunisphaera sp.]|nr:glycosyltransferase family 4 protein [Lacunisphaera sp.]